MTKEQAEAVERIRELVKDVAPVDRPVLKKLPGGKTVKLRQVNHVTLIREDILAACAVAEADEIVEALQQGCEASDREEVAVMAKHAHHLLECVPLLESPPDPATPAGSMPTPGGEGELARLTDPAGPGSTV